MPVLSQEAEADALASWFESTTRARCSQASGRRISGFLPRTPDRSDSPCRGSLEEEARRRVLPRSHSGETPERAGILWAM